jgi:hypothetical protein
MDKQEVKEHLSAFSSLFDKNDTKIRKEQDGRSQCKAPASVDEAFVARCKEVLPMVAFDVAALKSTDSVKANLPPFASTTYGIVNSNDTGGSEKDYLPCIRMVSQGTRRVVFTPCKDIMDFMEAKGASMENRTTVAGIKAFFFGMNSETVQEYVKTAKVVHGTVDAGSYLYVPGAWFFAERTSTDKHTLGLRAGLFAPDPSFKMRVQGLLEARKSKGIAVLQIEAAVSEVEQQHAAAEAQAKADAAEAAKKSAAEESQHGA